MVTKALFPLGANSSSWVIRQERRALNTGLDAQNRLWIWSRSPGQRLSGRLLFIFSQQCQHKDGPPSSFYCNSMHAKLWEVPFDSPDPQMFRPGWSNSLTDVEVTENPAITLTHFYSTLQFNSVTYFQHLISWKDNPALTSTLSIHVTSTLDNSIWHH